MSPGSPLVGWVSFGTGLNGSLASTRYIHGEGQLLYEVQDATPYRIMSVWRDCHYNNDPAIDNADAVLDALRERLQHVTR